MKRKIIILSMTLDSIVIILSIITMIKLSNMLDTITLIALIMFIVFSMYTKMVSFNRANTLNILNINTVYKNINKILNIILILYVLLLILNIGQDKNYIGNIAILYVIQLFSFDREIAYYNDKILIYRFKYVFIKNIKEVKRMGSKLNIIYKDKPNMNLDVLDNGIFEQLKEFLEK